MKDALEDGDRRSPGWPRTGCWTGRSCNLRKYGCRAAAMGPDATRWFHLANILKTMPRDDLLSCNASELRQVWQRSNRLSRNGARRGKTRRQQCSDGHQQTFARVGARNLVPAARNTSDFASQLLYAALYGLSIAPGFGDEEGELDDGRRKLGLEPCLSHS